MEKIVMSVEELAEILKQVRELPDGVIGDEYCSVCREMHDNDCPVSSDKDCPHEEIVEYRYFVRQHYKQFITKNSVLMDKVGMGILFADGIDIWIDDKKLLMWEQGKDFVKVFMKEGKVYQFDVLGQKFSEYHFVEL